jgi:4-diphosphocytidyl-2-C-methyl-D-erythritol kinase
MAALRAGDADALGAALHNDLEEAACSLRPALRQTLDTGRVAGALGAIVSGSGPTVVFLARSAEHAIDIAVALSATGTCRAVKRCHGPVGGARIVGEG